MESRVLRNFLAVAQEENITRAAERLHIAQPSLSKQLIDLEQELGKQLLIRGKRKITLTEDGVLLRKRAEEIVLLLEKTEREISASDAACISGEVSVGGTPVKDVLEAAAALRAEHTDVRFHFYSSDATDVEERLEHGSLDFAVLLEPVDPTRYEYIPLHDHLRWGLFMPADCVLAAQPVVMRNALRSVPLILHRRAGLQRAIMHWAQVEPEQLQIAATYNVINGNPFSFVRSGLGCLLTSENYFGRCLDADVCFRPLEPTLEMRHALVWKRYTMFSRAAEAFLKHVRRVVKE